MCADRNEGPVDIKEKMKGAKANGKSEPKNQKTIVDFFKRQSSAPTPVAKVGCPACDREVPQSKLNWHLDQDCKSRSQPRRKRDTNLAKRKKILKLVKEEIRNKKKKKILLSDDESDTTLDSDSDVVVLDSDDEESLYIPPSMVETRIFEIDDVLGGSTDKEWTSSSCKTSVNSVTSPEEEGKIIERQDLNSAERRIAVIKSDWKSPYFSPAKVVTDGNSEPSEELSSAQVISAGHDVRKMLESDWVGHSPASPSNENIDREMKDFEPSPIKYATPHKHSKQSRHSPASPTDENIDKDMNDFEPSPIKYATPRKYSKQSPKSSCNISKKSMDVNKNIFDQQTSMLAQPSSENSSQQTVSNLPKLHVTNCEKSGEDSEDDFEEPMQFRTPEKRTRKKLKIITSSTKIMKPNGDTSISSPAGISSSTIENETDGEFFTPVMNPGIVSPMRSPSPLTDSSSQICASPVTKTSEDVKKKLFSPPNSPKLDGKVSFEPAPSSSKASTSFEPTPSTSKASISFEPAPSTSKASTSPVENMLQELEIDDPFDALLASASQKIEESETLSSQNHSNSSSPSQRSNTQFRRGLIKVRSPRKINQSIKSTSLLKSSPQNVSKSFFARRRSTSVSPMKVGNSETSLQSSQSPQNVDGKYDKAMFRGHKGYYLENFLLILECVVSEPKNLTLFNDEDMSVVNNFHQLSLEAQKLYVRLFQRKVKWNKVSKIEYRDICDQVDTELYVNELSYANFLLLETEFSDLKEVLQMLSVDDLKKLCKSMKVSATGKKEDLVNAALKLSKEQRSIMSVFSRGLLKNCPILKQAKEFLGRCCIVNKDVRRVFLRIIMLYGLPRYDDDDENNPTQLTTLLMVNLGKMVFPKYEIIRKLSIFRSRDDLIRFESCNQILTDVSECLESHKWEEALAFCQQAKTIYEELVGNKELMDHDMSLPRFLRCYSSISVLVHILSCSVECYQRLKNYRKAVEQLRFLLNQTTHLQDYRGRWYDRLALNLEMHRKLPAEAVDVIKSALDDPEVRKGHRLSLSLRAERMAASPRFRSLAPTILELPLLKPVEAPKVIIEGRCLPGDAGYKRVFISQDSARHAGEGEVTVCSVEELVLSYYRKEGYNEGLHREGATVNSLFGLFFWDIIYSPIPDVFQSRHQAAPLDLDYPHFYTSRKEMIEERLTQLRNFTDEEAEKEIERVWNENFGKTAMIAWDIFRNLDYAKV